MRRDTLIDFFDDLARKRGDFLVHDDGYRARTLSYAEVGRAARGFAARLAAAGLVKGDKVVFFSENRPEWIVSFWGCLLAGVVVVPIDYRASSEFLGRVVRIVSAKVVLTGEDVPELPPMGSTAVWRLHDLDWPDGAPPPATLGPDDVAEIIFTSGATAEPKGVIITHRNVLANIVPVEREILKYRRWIRLFSPIRFLNLLPLSHMFGQAMATLIPPMLPGVVVFMRGYNPGQIADQIRKRRVSVLVSVPKILDVLREHVLRVAPDTPERIARGKSAPPKSAVLRIAGRWWRHRTIHGLLGPKFWAMVVGAAPLDGELESFWGEIGYAVIQGYGLTETAPIVTLNHPFGTKRGSVGKAIPGVEIKIADDGEILVRGDNVTTGYFNDAGETARAFADGWFHTGDVGEVGADGQVYIRGRKKEMIVTPEGLNVFPEDVERVLNQIDGVRDSAVVGVPIGASHEERVHAVLVLWPGAEIDAIVRAANEQLADPQKIRRALAWPDAELPRTEGTRKLKRAVIREWVKNGEAPSAAVVGTDKLSALIAKYAGRADVPQDANLEELGLSSLERVELMVALEDTFQTRIDEGAFAGARSLADLRTLVTAPAGTEATPPAPVDFPSWNRRWPARAVRRLFVPAVILPLTRAFAWIRVEGREHLDRIDSPVIFAANHQSHMDTPVIMASLPARLRYRLAPAMAKEFFKAHFFPATYGRRERFTNGLNYYLASLVFNAFPLPQREAGARQTLHYIGEVLEDGFSVLIFPEGRRTKTGEIDRFQPGVGMMAARLGVSIVPVRIDGLDRVLHTTWKMAKPGRVRVAFGPPITLKGEDYEALAAQVERAVRAL